MRVRGVTLIILSVVALAAALIAWWAMRAPPPVPIRIGVLHSLTGPQAVSEKPLLDAYRLAVEEINAAGGIHGRPLILDVRDGASEPATFAREAERFLREADDDRADLIVGGWSSASRKALLPVLHQFDSLLLYPARFEGLESSPHVAYFGMVPNQQIGPAIEWAQKLGAKRFFFIGNDGLFARATNAVARDLIEARGGTMAGEAFLPPSGGDPRTVAESVVAAHPDAIINALHGDANQGLMRALRSTGIDPATTMVIALSIGESEIRTWDPALFKDVIVSCSYVRTLDRDSNQRFLTGLRRVAGSEVVAGDGMASAYMGLRFWADAAREAGTTKAPTVRRALRGRHMDGPGGTVVIDPESLHAWKPIRIGRVRADGDVDILWDSASPVPSRAWPLWRSRSGWEDMVLRWYEGWGQRWEAPPSVLPRTAVPAPAIAPLPDADVPIAPTPAPNKGVNTERSLVR